MAVVIYMPALALAAVTDLDIYACILLIGALSAIYSAFGGMSGVVWTDFAQTIFLIGAAVLAFILIVVRVDGGLGTMIDTAAAANKLTSSVSTATSPPTRSGSSSSAASSR